VSKGDAFIKFEPFVLHVQCASLADAQLLVSTDKLCFVHFTLLRLLNCIIDLLI